MSTEDEGSIGDLVGAVVLIGYGAALLKVAADVWGSRSQTGPTTNQTTGTPPATHGGTELVIPGDADFGQVLLNASRPPSDPEI